MKKRRGNPALAKIKNCFIWPEKAQKKHFRGKQRFLHSSTLYLFRATAMPNLSAVTFFSGFSSYDLVWVSKSVTPALPLCSKIQLYPKDFLM